MEYKSKIILPWDPDEVLNTGTSFKARIKTTDQAYSSVPLIYRALDLRCDTLCSVPRYLYKGKYGRGEPIEGSYPFEDILPLHDLLWKAEAAVLLTGAAWVLKLKNEFAYRVGLQMLNPYTVQTDTKEGELRVWQQTEQGRFPREAPGYWTLEDFIPLMGFHPLSDVGPGVAAVEVAMPDGVTLASVSTFLSNFFGADALPVTMVTVPTGTKETERSRVEKWFKDKIAKLSPTVARVLAVSADVKIEKLTAELSTMNFDKIDDHAVKNVARAFKIPKTVLEADSANRATAEVEFRTFIDKTIVPRCKFYQNALNPFLAEFNQRLEFAPQELPEMQTDEAERADSLSQLVSAGVPLLAALDMLGYDLSEDAQALVEKAEAEKKKLRERPVVVPEEDEKEDMKADLDKWMRKVLKRVKAGKSAGVEFESDLIPPEVKGKIMTALGSVTDEQSIRTIFAEVQ